jgi:hypothetical protein
MEELFFLLNTATQSVKKKSKFLNTRKLLIYKGSDMLTSHSQVHKFWRIESEKEPKTAVFRAFFQNEDNISKRKKPRRDWASTGLIKN